LINIALDVLGGDLEDGEKIYGALNAVKCDDELHVVLVGNEASINSYLDREEFSSFGNNFSLVHSTKNFGMQESPSKILKTGKDSSLYKAVLEVKEESCVGVVSAGNTGAQMAASLFVLGRIKNISRPGIAIPLPTRCGSSTLIDAGANVDSKPQNLLDFALMGSLYHSAMYNITNPPIGIINNGAEQSKGNILSKSSYSLIEKSFPDSFKGFIEGRDIFNGEIKVLVCDGFVGNVILKTVEGSFLLIKDFLKKDINSSLKQKLGGYLIKDSFKHLKKLMDYREYGGSPLLGVKGISIICHGSSDQLAIKNALLQALKMHRGRLIQKISNN
jgi:glycerol-3-phosphate acyltransferase PlsX